MSASCHSIRSALTAVSGVASSASASPSARRKFTSPQLSAKSMNVSIAEDDGRPHARPQSEAACVGIDVECEQRDPVVPAQSRTGVPIDVHHSTSGRAVSGNGEMRLPATSKASKEGGVLV
jgi:hypothetical protein